MSLNANVGDVNQHTMHTNAAPSVDGKGYAQPEDHRIVNAPRKLSKVEKVRTDLHHCRPASLSLRALSARALSPSLSLSRALSLSHTHTLSLSLSLSSAL